MERNEWLKAVYEAACRVAEKHGSGLRRAIESEAGAGELHGEVRQVAAETIAAAGELWPFIVHSAHPEPPGIDWRSAPSFEGAAVRVATAALAADIQDILESLSTGRALQFRKEKAGTDAGPADEPSGKRRGRKGAG
ncbi:MAG TPA: hypothetical protein PK280_08175 [Planctomycetota bacterium]|nr:hypothetical protein [Planctomycetota bacterium]